jgi:chorismate lyase
LQLLGHNRRDFIPANTMARFWHTPICLAPRHLRPWLTARASLTARLQESFGPIRVQVISEKPSRAHRDEQPLLHRHRIDKWHYTRDVLLLAGDQARVFAHSVAPRDAIRHGLRLLGRIGNKPLGAALFADPQIRRGPLGWKQIDRRDPLWQKAARAAGPLPARLWARRSQFIRGSARLLVTEVFLKLN